MAKTPRGRGGGGSPRDLFRQAQTRAVGAAAQTATSPGVTTPPVSSRAAASEPPKKKVPPGQFLREVRAEGRKITWPSRRETWITSVMVFIMVALAAAFFALVDGTLSFLLQEALQLASRT